MLSSQVVGSWCLITAIHVSCDMCQVLPNFLSPNSVCKALTYHLQALHPFILTHRYLLVPASLHLFTLSSEVTSSRCAEFRWLEVQKHVIMSRKRKVMLGHWRFIKARCISAKNHTEPWQGVGLWLSREWDHAGSSLTLWAVAHSWIFRTFCRNGAAGCS